MADAIVSVVLQQLATIIDQEVRQEVRLVRGVKSQVQKLESNFKAIQAVLEDAERREVKEATVKDWLDKVKDVSYDIDDVLDEWSTAILKQEIEGADNAPAPTKKVCSCAPSSCISFNQVMLRRDIALKIKDLNERLDVIALEKDKFNLNLSKGIDEKPERLKTTSLVDVSKVHGRDDVKKTVMSKLLCSSSSSQEKMSLRIICISGMGGIGKTTLAQLVYNAKEVEAHFEKRMWVCVSDPFDEIRIAKAIISALDGCAPNLEELEDLLRRVCELIDRKKFLLVLDDVWTTNYKKWDELKKAFQHGASGSRILVTTRKEEAAKMMETTDTDIIRLGLLSKEDCWTVFSHIAFFDRSPEECERLEKVGREIAGKCKGLPLAAKTLGSLLRLKKTRGEWQSVLESELWEIEDVKQGLIPALLLSYYDLSSAARRCFTYCAIFPKDERMRKDSLIRYWMAQGYLGTAGSREMETIGEECFENLAMHSFFQDFERTENDNGITGCKMHDIVHDFAQFLTKNEVFMMEVHGAEQPMIDSSYVKARHSFVSLAKMAAFPNSICGARNLRSLIVTRSLGESQHDSFSRLTCLRTLNLSGCGIKEVSSDIGKLIHLRYLDLSGNQRLKTLPETVYDLFNLQTLNLSMCSCLEELPHGIGKLVNLRHLLNHQTSINFMPKGIDKLTALRTLTEFVISDDGNLQSNVLSLADLKNLNNLQGFVLIKGLGKVTDVNQAKRAELKNKKHLLELSLDFEGVGTNDNDILDALEPPPYLESLAVFSYKGTVLLPNWMMSLSYLRKLALSDWEKCECLPPLGKLSSLESLTIQFMRHVKNVSFEFLGIEMDNSGISSVIAFPKLKKLAFAHMRKWEEWDFGITKGIKEEDITNSSTTSLTSTITIMPCLSSLTILKCPMLKTLPDHLLGMTQLKKMSIYGSDILRGRFQREQAEDWPKISHIPNILIDNMYVQRNGHPITGSSILRFPTFSKW